jgi:hypothetical protein
LVCVQVCQYLQTSFDTRIVFSCGKDYVIN